MNNIGLKKCVAGAGFAILSLSIMGVTANAQTVSELQYQKINGQIYAYESSNPAGVYLVSNPTPEQIGLSVNAEAKEKEFLNADRKGNLPSVYPYNANRRTYGVPYVPALIPARAAESNSALPAITFRNPTVSPQNQPRANPIGGLPRYPGKNYSPGYNAAP